MGPRRPVLLGTVDPRVKLALVLTYCICVVSTPSGTAAVPGAYALLLGLGLVVNYGVAGGALVRVLRAVPIVLVPVVFVPFLKPGQPLWSWGPLVVTVEGVRTAGVILCSALLCVGAFSLVAATTPQERVVEGLRGIGLPAALCGVIAFMLRYLHVLRPELNRLRDARDARTIGPAGPGPVRSGANLLGSLFVRSMDRAGRVADAMAARGYDGRFRVHARQRASAGDLLFGAVSIVLVLAIRIVGPGLDV
jgi:cobalt/nickel transport system permease protein